MNTETIEAPKEKVEPKFKETVKVLIDQHGEKEVFNVVFFLKNAVLHYVGSGTAEMDNRGENRYLPAHWFIDDLGDAAMSEIFS